MLYFVFCLCAAVDTVSTAGLKERMSLLELQVIRDSYRTKTDIMELRNSVESLNASLDICLDLKDNAVITSETDEHRVDEMYQIELNEAARFHVLASAISEEKKAMRKKVDELNDEVRQSMKDIVLQVEQKFIEIDEKGLTIKTNMERNSQVISTIEQNMTIISQSSFGIVEQIEEAKQNISRIEKGLAELKSQNEKFYKDWEGFKDNIRLEMQSIVTSYFQKCSPNWTNHEGTCYFLVSQPLDWVSAVKHCHKLDGKLAEPNTKEKMNFILESYLDDDKRLWIGASDIETEGVYVWNTSKNPVEYLPWKPGQPNNYGGDQDCINVWNTALNDNNCNGLLPSLCEKSVEDLNSGLSVL